MKTLLALALLLAGSTLALADEVALLQIQFAGKKGTRPVAIEFYEGDAPATVANFKKLARKGFYKGCAFHRAFPGVLVQTGDPLSRSKRRTKVGTGGPGYTLAPEIRRKHTTGTVSAARLPDKLNPSRVSNGSQFFVALAPIPAYDGQYTAFGHVLYGLDVLNEISNLPVDTNDYPTQRVTIRSVKIMPREVLPAEPAPLPANAGSAKKPWWKIF